MAEDIVTLSETVKVSTKNTMLGLDPLAGMAVKHCIVCGKILCEPYSVSGPAPTVKACHGPVREDYAPSVVLDPEKAKKGQLYAIRGEPMDHVRARAASER